LLVRQQTKETTNCSEYGAGAADLPAAEAAKAEAGTKVWAAMVIYRMMSMFLSFLGP
jgi:hypothetical protein